MKLYLSSFRLGNNPQQLRQLISENKKVAIINNAIDHKPEQERTEKLEEEINDLQSLNLHVEELDLRNYFGKTDELKKRLEAYSGVWVRGGNTFVLRRAYAYSGFDKLLQEKLSDKEFLYAGYSAGICILAPSLHGYELVDDPNIVPQGYKPEIIWDGLGLVNYALAPHYHSEHPEAKMVEEEVQYCINNKILFKALRDGEVIVDET